MKKYFKLLIIALALAIIVPQIALAAWWNPMSWGIWSNIFNKRVFCVGEGGIINNSLPGKKAWCCPGLVAQIPEMPGANGVCVKPNKPPVVGGDKDAHGCIGSAGYAWCEAKQKCIRHWEEKCEVSDWSKYTQDQLMAMYDKDWSSQPMFFKGLEKNYLIIDEGTAPPPRGLVIYDLNAKKEVLSDSYSPPLDITNNAVAYWNPINQKVTAENCPDSLKWLQEGLGAGMESHVSFDLATLTKKDLGQIRCQPRQ